MAAKEADPKWAWAPYEPGGARPWDIALAAHLLRRAGFGGNWGQLQQALSEGPKRTVDRLLNPAGGIAEFDQRMEALGASVAISDDSAADECARLWLYRMQQTPHPLLEKITFFWHNYFAVAGERVNKTALMERHLRLLRRNALGRFDALLGEICRDPATLIALDAGANHKSRPSEGFAAALLGSYTVGPGPLGEKDVREAARAFTGTFVLRGEYRMLAQEHDAGSKTVLGRAGESGDDVVRIALAHPATARTVARKLYGWLISENGNPPDEMLAPLAEAFGKDFDIAKLVGTMLRSNLFFSPAAYRQRVKSPLEFALNIGAALETPLPPAQLHGLLAALGQKLLEPPARTGWPGGRRWLNQFTVVARSNLAAGIVAKVDVEAIERKGGGRPAFWAQLLLGQASNVPGEMKNRELVQAIVTSPDFQLS